MAQTELLNLDNIKKLLNLDNIKKYIGKKSIIDHFIIGFLILYIIFFSHSVPIEISLLLQKQVFKIFIIIAIIFLLYHNKIAAILLTIAYILSIISEKKSKNNISIKEKFSVSGDDDDSYADEESDSDEESYQSEAEESEDEESEDEESEDEESNDGDDNLEQYRTDNPELTDNFKKLHDTLHKYETFLKQK